MSGFLDRLGAAFVARPEVAAAPRVAAVAPSVAVLCRPEHAWVVGGAVALRGDGPAVVAVWGAAAPPVRAPASPGARKLAVSLSQRGHAASASGRLVRVSVGGSSAEAAAESARVAAAAGEVPCVTVVAGPRDERVDVLLRTHDRAVVDADGDLAGLVTTSLWELGVSGETLRLDDVPSVARALAAAGVALLPPLRGLVEEALR